MVLPSYPWKWTKKLKTGCLEKDDISDLVLKKMGITPRPAGAPAPAAAAPAAAPAAKPAAPKK